ncbi:MAG: hypothetical protein ACRECH_12910 [Nitrososphaerales archaeon]
MPSTRVYSVLDEKLKHTYDDLIFQLGTSWSEVIRESLNNFLPVIEARAKVVEAHKYPRTITTS